MTRDALMLKVLLGCSLAAAIVPLATQFSFLTESQSHDVSILGAIFTAVSGVLIASPMGLSAEARLKYMGQANQDHDSQTKP